VKLLNLGAMFLCERCAQPVQFEEAQPLFTPPEVVGACMTSRCSLFERRFRFVIPTVEVQPLDD
jgi:hypothetical protein